MSFTGYIVNGWNNVKDNNDAKTVIGSVTVKPTGKLTLIGNYIVGKEQAENADGGTRNLVDLVASYAASDKLSVLGNFDYGHDKVAGDERGLERRRGRPQVSGDVDVGILARYETSPTVTVRDRPRPTVQEVTLTGEYKAPAGLLARIEFRTDFSDDPFFLDETTELKKNQTTLSVSFIYAFSSK